MKSKQNSIIGKSTLLKKKIGKGSRHIESISGCELEGARIAKRLIQSVGCQPTAIQLASAINSLIPVPLTLARVSETEAKVAGFAQVMVTKINIVGA